MIIITILGWILAAVIFIILALTIYNAIDNYFIERKVKIKRQGVREFADNCKHTDVHWLNGKEREPYRELFQFIIDRVGRGYIGGEDLRNKVDQIIEKHK